MSASSSNLSNKHSRKDFSVSGWLHWFNNRKQSFCLLNTIYSTYLERLDYYTKQLRKESNESNEHEQSGKPSESVESASSSASTCTRASSRTTTRATSTGSTTTGRSSTTGSSKGRSTTGNSLVRKHKYTTITTSRECANDLLNREYAEYLASTSAGREDVSTGVRVSDEPRDFKPTDADSGDSIERCIGIPAGVTV